jgi:hypothetical protein
MARQGLHLQKVDCLRSRFVFRRGEPAEMTCRLDFQVNRVSPDHVQLFVDAGWEHVDQSFGWQFWRAPMRAGRTPEIFTDTESRIRKYQRLLWLFAVCYVPFFFMLLTKGQAAWDTPAPALPDPQCLAGQPGPFLARGSAPTDFSPEGQLAMPLLLAILCAEDIPRLTPALRDADEPGSFLRGHADRIAALCPLAGVPAAAPPSTSPIHAPALLLSGALDPVTPPDGAARAMTNAAAGRAPCRPWGRRAGLHGAAAARLPRPASRAAGQALPGRDRHSPVPARSRLPRAGCAASST